MKEDGHGSINGSVTLETSIYMPAEAINALRSELSNLVGEKLAKGVLFRFGYRCGEILVQRTKMDDSQEKELSETLPKIWGKTGLGKIVKIEEISEKEVIIEQEDSTEAQAMDGVEAPLAPVCDYTRGYLAAIANQLTNSKFYCEETACISEGKTRCIFKLVMFPHKVYVTKNHHDFEDI